jgi:PAS domain S-box-containing protein
VVRSAQADYNGFQEGWAVEHPASWERARLQHLARRLRLLREIDRAILGASSLQQTAAVGLEGFRQLVRCQRASVVLFDLGADEVILLATRSDHPVQLEAGARTRLSHAFFLGHSPQGHPSAVEDLRDITETHPWVEALRAEGVRGYASVPLSTDSAIVGALTFGLSHPGQPPAEAIEIATDIACQLALATVNVRLREQVLRHAEELETHVTVRTEALRSSEARFRAMFEAAPLGVVLAGRNGRVLQANPALVKVLGYSAEELQRMTLSDLGASHQTRRDLRKRFERLMLGQDESCHLEAPLRRRDAGTVWAFITVARTHAASEEADFAVAMVEDVTAERQTRMALIQAERQAITGRLGASLAHEINNPLQSIIGCLGLAEEILPSESEACRFLDVARAELQRVARLVAQLRDLQHSTESERLERTDLNALLQELLTLNEPKCRELGVQLVWRPASHLPAIRLMPDRIREVFLNLILNALDAMPNGGELVVRTMRTRKPAGVKVTVQDTGEGMSPAMLERLFEPFYSTKPQGLGLGLFTSRSIVEQHGGTIKASGGPGRGTTISVRLPVHPPGAA